MQITFPDKSTRDYRVGLTPLEIAKTISPGLARQVVGSKVNGLAWDVTRPVEEDASLKLFTWQDPAGKQIFWHSSAHLLAEALEALYENVKFGIGPSIEQGFYYDVDFGDFNFSSDDFPKIEAKMLELARQKNPYIRQEISKSEAITFFEKKQDPYKLELLKNLKDGEITFYQQGNFTDLCRGTHLPHTGFIKALKLTNVAAAYWRGRSDNKMLTRIYGISFPKAKELKEYLNFLEEAQKRDHRRIGKQLELFTFSQNVGLGLPLWLPKGTIVREQLELFMRRAQQKAGYQAVVTPHIGSKSLYVTSGHYAKYKDDSFQPIETPRAQETFLLKPMNCPHHCEIYKSKPRSYRDLPLRLSEFGTVYRYEQSGELHGLTRVRGFTQDDAHIFCMPEQVKEEFIKVIDLVIYVFNSLGFEDYKAQISLRDPNNKTAYIGDDDLWEKAEREIKEAAEEKHLEAEVVLGEAAFYGPKLDFMVKDVLKREWQLGTIQVDYQLPERFELEYVDSKNQKSRPVMIHRAPFGSMERFLAILLENCKGDLPLWLAPVQVILLPISEKYHDYVELLIADLEAASVRVEADYRAETVSRKIREAELQKIPYMLIIGEREYNNRTVNVRERYKGVVGDMKLVEFMGRFEFGHPQ